MAYFFHWKDDLFNLNQVETITFKFTHDSMSVIFNFASGINQTIVTSRDSKDAVYSALA